MDLNKTTLSGQIYDILRQDILTQRIRLGEKLTLKHLQERFGVSSTPIREALTRLAEEELVVSYSNIGVNVISIGEQDLKELYEFMGDLDALAILYTSHYPDQEKVQKALAEKILHFIRRRIFFFLCPRQERKSHFHTFADCPDPCAQAGEHGLPFFLADAGK